MGFISQFLPVLLVLLHLSGIVPQLCNDIMKVSSIRLIPSLFRGTNGTTRCLSFPNSISIICTPQSTALLDGKFGPEQPNFVNVEDRLQFVAWSSNAPSFMAFQMSSPTLQITSIDLYLMYDSAQDIGIPNFRLFRTHLPTITNPAQAKEEIRFEILNNELLSVDDNARVKVTLHLLTPFASVGVLLSWELQSVYKAEWFLLSEIRFCGDIQPVFPPGLIEFQNPSVDSLQLVEPSAEVLANGSLLLNCTVSNEGSFIWRWRKGQSNLRIDPKILIQTADANRTSILTIKQLNFMDANVYSCEATYKNLISYETRRYELQFPTIIEGRPLVIGYLGDSSVTLTCEIYGYATTSDPIAWSNSGGVITSDTFKFSILIGEGSNMLIYSNGSTGQSIVSMLTINDLREEDEGNYTCSLPGAGDSESTIQLLTMEGTSPMNVVTSVSGTDQRTGVVGTVVGAVVASLVVIAIICIIIAVTVIFFRSQKRGSNSIVHGRNSSVDDSLAMERRLTVTKADIEWQIPHIQNEGGTNDDGRRSEYVTVAKDAPLSAQTSPRTDYYNLYVNNDSEACNTKNAPHTMAVEDGRNQDPRVKASAEHRVNMYAESRIHKITLNQPPKLTKLKENGSMEMLNINPIYLPMESSEPVSEEHCPVVYAVVSKDSATKRKSVDTTTEPVYSEALTPALFKEPADASDTSLQPYGPVYAIVKISHDTVKKIDSAHFQEQKLIGVGQFGEVALAKTINLSHHDLNLSPFDDDRSVPIKVAIKKLRSNANDSLRENFDKEIKFMSRLKDDNIVCLLAISSGRYPFIVMEYMDKGDLHQFLDNYDSMVTKKSPKLGQISISVLVYMAMQISSGMKYLASHNYVHRDLATRNCLVGDDYIVKIADFGMSRNLYAESYYKVRGRAMLPIRWMATESFFGRFSEKTDIWSFGVVMWEIFTLCKQPPYKQLNDQELIQDAIRGEGRILLDKPMGCPRIVYDVMLRCWEQRTQERAGFVVVFNSLSAQYELLIA